MFTFPEWSDLGLDVSQPVIQTWEEALLECQRHRYYWDGGVFDEKVQLEAGNEDPPLMFPVALNLVKMLTVSQADATFGEWEDQPILMAPRKDIEAKDSDTSAAALATQILDDSQAGSMLWEHDLDRQVYGGGALKIIPAANHASHIRWVRVPRENFFPIWDPDDEDSLLEAYIVIPMTAEQAIAKYGVKPRGELTYRIEHWTPSAYSNRIDEIELKSYSGANPWGIVPFVYTPRLRFNYWWGDSMAREIEPVQDDLNARVADVSDAVNYNAHPIRWGLNMPKGFKAENYPLGPNAFWDMGRALPGAPEPQVGMLEAQHAFSPEVFSHIQFIYDWARTSVFAPPIAFGEDNGGGQRSGITLEIRMWPLIKSTRRGRAYLSKTINRALYISALILRQKQWGDIPAMAIKSLLAGRIAPSFYQVLPRDHQAIVDEVVKLGSLAPPRISMQTAQTILGRGPNELERIKRDLEEWAQDDEDDKSSGEGKP
jgi:hypothetical protein